VERPEIAFLGRSNVGKSSLMNKILNRKKLVQVSSTPGKTRLINFFEINEAFYLVDLPGYGYARVPDSLRDQWRKMIEEYLTGRNPSRGWCCWWISATCPPRPTGPCWNGSGFTAIPPSWQPPRRTRLPGGSARGRPAGHQPGAGP
jgi:hypothetical protein